MSCMRWRWPFGLKNTLAPGRNCRDPPCWTMNDVDKSFYHDGSPTASASKDAFLFDLSENYSIICKD
jgi:hypothetical protein